MKILITNVHVLTMDAGFTEYNPGFISFTDDAITAVGAMADLPAETDARVVDGKGAIAMPGMVNTHTHIGMIPFRSLGDDTPDRLTQFLFPLEQACMTETLAYHSGKYAIAEMQLAGITTFFDMYYFEDALAQAADEMGARAILAETILAEAPDAKTPYGGLDYAAAFIPKWLDHPLITPAVAPHAPYTNSSESLKQAFALAERYAVPFSLHVSEMTFEMEKYRREYSQTPVAYLDDLGVLTERTLAAHCIFATEEDIALLKERNVAVAHCIGANTKSAKGIAPVKAMLDAGLRVGLGTDGPSSGNTLDLFSQMKMVAYFHKTALKDRAAFPTREIVRLATIGGAEALGMAGRIGSLEPGKQADITLIETDSVNMFPVFDPYAVLVYSAQAHNVRDVFVAGKQVVVDKKLVRTDLHDLRMNLDGAMAGFRVEVEKRG